MRAFYLKAASEALQKLSFGDCTLNNIRFVKFERKEKCTIDSGKFFCSKYSDFFKYTPVQMDRLQKEFLYYQLLEKSDIPTGMWEEAIVYEEGEGEKKENGIIGWLQYGVSYL